MAAAEHAITIHDERTMEPILPPNQGVEAFKDVVCGSVGCPFGAQCSAIHTNEDNFLGCRNGRQGH